MRFEYDPSASSKTVSFKTIEVDGLNIAYREAGDPKNPKLVLLHGFPSSSHQYRNLMRGRSASLKFGAGYGQTIGRGVQSKPRRRSQVFSSRRPSTPFTQLAIPTQSSSALITGTWTTTFLNALTQSRYSSTSSTTIGPTWSSTQSGRHSSKTTNPRRSSFGAKATSSSRQLAVRLSSRFCPRRRCTG